MSIVEHLQWDTGKLTRIEFVADGIVETRPKMEYSWRAKFIQAKTCYYDQGRRPRGVERYYVNNRVRY